MLREDYDGRNIRITPSRSVGISTPKNLSELNYILALNAPNIAQCPV